jgi:uroporphyrinogen-III synthase
LNRVWITRAQPGANATAQRITALGFEPVVAPALVVKELPAVVDLAGVGALAFTSVNAVRAFARRSPVRDLPVFVVGMATAVAAKEAGFGQIESADGNVHSLARLIAGRATEQAGILLHPGAAEAAGDLVGDLKQVGIPARAVALYDTVPADVPASVLEALASIGVVLVHSPKAARRLATILAGQTVAHMTALGLSPEVCAPLAEAGLAQTIAAPLPTEDALLSLLVRTTP